MAAAVNYYFGKQPKLTEALYIAIGDQSQLRRAQCMSWTTCCSTDRIAEAIHVPLACSSIWAAGSTDSCIAARAYVMRNCVKRLVDPGYLHSSRGVVYNALCLELSTRAMSLFTSSALCLQ
jgi:hypothetical protein